ncbi:MAG TPA: response regulator transcription factor [Bacteroidales bacterium]|nr:response regulator transcription factor [Bacteroidales bacterium]
MRNIDFEVDSKYTHISDFIESKRAIDIHILILNTNTIVSTDIQNVELILRLYPKIKILIISYSQHEETIFSIIRAGAKGFLAHDSQRQDLIEAIYTLRNGHDYFSKCITQILLHRYVQSIQNNESSSIKGIDLLSSREIEILTLWGNSYTNQEIADALFISVRTVESHKTHIMQKLQLKTAVDLMKYAIKNNIIQL